MRVDVLRSRGGSGVQNGFCSSHCVMIVAPARIRQSLFLEVDKMFVLIVSRCLQGANPVTPVRPLSYSGEYPILSRLYHCPIFLAVQWRLQPMKHGCIRRALTVSSNFEEVQEAGGPDADDVCTIESGCCRSPITDFPQTEMHRDGSCPHYQMPRRGITIKVASRTRGLGDSPPQPQASRTKHRRPR